MNVSAVIHFHGKFDVNLGRLMEINKKTYNYQKTSFVLFTSLC